jgi:protein-S-isoprenylcysteine O-methyltransferase Ste14
MFCNVKPGRRDVVTAPSSSSSSGSPSGQAVVGHDHAEGGALCGDTGPYSVVCHPIYTGAIAATVATAAAEATLPAVIGLVLITLGLWLKARTEERFLREELGPEAYDAYRRRVPMLLPFGPRAA